MSKSNAALLAGLSDRRPIKAIERDMTALPLGQMVQESEPAREIPIASITESPFQRRVPFTDEALESLATSIAEFGIITPIIVRELDAGGFELITGHRRTAACKRIGRETIPAVVRVMSDRDAAIALTADNTQHAAMSDWELYKHAAMLLDGNYVRNMSHLAETLGVARPTAYNLIAFGSLPPDVQSLLDAKPAVIGGNLAFDLARLSKEHADLVTEAVQLIDKGKLKQTAAMVWIESRINPPPRKVIQRRERSFGDPERAIRFVATADKAEVSGAIDIAKLETLIEANLSSLQKT